MRGSRVVKVVLIHVKGNDVSHREVGQEVERDLRGLLRKVQEKFPGARAVVSGESIGEAWQLQTSESHIKYRKSNREAGGAVKEKAYGTLVQPMLKYAAAIWDPHVEASVIEVHSSNDQSIVPAPGDIVTAKVTVVGQRFCKCMIKCIRNTVLTRPYRGMLRKEDVRATEKDSVEMIKCFRPGDIILARVVSFLPITEVQSYNLSTAENELGVVIAHSEAGGHQSSQRFNGLMYHISWGEFMYPVAGTYYSRLVAKLTRGSTGMCLGKRRLSRVKAELR
ncbi:hypothetical protein PR048_029985 [Dryococelus australis]|uniref:Exosome complex component CSL4 C-terminal domain-containing protein n=1 Tax=Dryococelus australis TaxID=614101 RepID=A0ABQ9G8H3_9NEOP|nr:hypothetical protein PR048_029985 [Dryococelus australis]